MILRLAKQSNAISVSINKSVTSSSASTSTSNTSGASEQSSAYSSNCNDIIEKLMTLIEKQLKEGLKEWYHCIEYLLLCSLNACRTLVGLEDQVDNWYGKACEISRESYRATLSVDNFKSYIEEYLEDSNGGYVTFALSDAVCDIFEKCAKDQKPKEFTDTIREVMTLFTMPGQLTSTDFNEVYPLFKKTFINTNLRQHEIYELLAKSPEDFMNSFILFYEYIDMEIENVTSQIGNLESKLNTLNVEYQKTKQCFNQSTTSTESSTTDDQALEEQCKNFLMLTIVDTKIEEAEREYRGEENQNNKDSEKPSLDSIEKEYNKKMISLVRSINTCKWFESVFKDANNARLLKFNKVLKR